MVKKCNRQPVTVCMATYNGIKFVEKQIETILPQLHTGDELLISDDGSSDGTWEYLLELSKGNSLVKLLKGPCKGVNANFFSLLKLASNDIIFISDQDDEWELNKIETVCNIFSLHNEIKVVLHKDYIYRCSDGNKIPCVRSRHGVMTNLIKNSYSGHRMAIRKEFVREFLKNTEKCPAYDQYIGLLAEKNKVGLFIDDILDTHLVHGNNITRPLSIKNKVLIRLKLLNCLFSK